MTYSRPATRQVNAFFDPAKPSPMKATDRFQVSQVTPGRILDYRNASVEGDNAGRTAAEVSNFIGELFSPEIKAFAVDQIKQQAKNKVGEIIATEDPIELMRAATPQQREVLRDLSPYARWVLEQEAARKSVAAYERNLPAEIGKRQALIYGADEQAASTAEAEARSAAFQSSGLDTLSPRTLSKFSDRLMTLDGGAKGLIQQGRYKQQDQVNRSVYRGGEKAWWSDISAERVAAAAQGPEALKAFVNQLPERIKARIKENSVSFLPADQAQETAIAVSERVLYLTSLGRFAEAKNFVQTLSAAAGLDVGVPGNEKLKFFGQKLQDGTTLKYLLSNQLQEITAAEERWAEQEGLRKAYPILQGLAQGDPTATAQWPSLVQTFKSPAELLGAVKGLGTMLNFADKATPAQQLREAELRIKLGEPGLNKDAWWKEVRSSGLTASQVLRLSDSAVKGVSGPAQQTASARRNSADEIALNGQDAARQAGVPLSDAGSIARITKELTVEASRETEKRIAELQAKGETVSDDTANSIFRQELQVAKVKAVQNKSQLQEMTQAGRAYRNLKQLQDNIKASGGVYSVDSFPEDVKTGYRAKYGPEARMETRDLEKYFYQQLSTLTEDGTANGKKLYPNAQQLLQNTIRQGQGNRAAEDMYSRRGLSRPGAPMASPNDPKLQGNKSKPSPTGDQASNPAVDFATKALSSVANVVLGGPANAATLDNADNMAAFAQVWTRRQPNDLKSPPLPQLAAATPTRSPSLAMTNDMHPMAIAIGIAEGTRTPNGGKTRAYSGHRDPGNGKMNVGTFSGQQGGSPGASDRRWMAALTTRATQVAPILQRIGLQPNTQGWNRVMFNVLDLSVQAPAAVSDFVQRLSGLGQAGFTVEGIAKARADSFFDPRTGRLDAPGFNNNYSRLFRDQRSRAGVWDYRRRL